ncbi:MAG: GTPase HflX [Aerococcus sp.]|nr:GTPase HflX [Aerococcus sp.]
MKERVILINVLKTPINPEHVAMQQEEFEQLVQTAGGEVTETIVQKRDQIDPKTLIGSGKVAEIKQRIAATDSELVIFYQSLSPSQNRNLQDMLDVPVIDRIQLILDIFSMHAKTKEAKLQVALAQKKYLLPRIQGLGTVLSRLGGGIGTRGPGETKLETDRRVIHNEINQIERDLKQVAANRVLNRKKRADSQLFRVGLFGYTNAGKSTIINGLAQADTYEKDELFATLSPLTRTYALDNHFKLSLTDTVGVIQDLPPMLIDAFHSTLEESMAVDLLLVVIDASSPYADRHQQVIDEILDDMAISHIPKCYIYNKMDQVVGMTDLAISQTNGLKISAKNAEDLVRLNAFIVDQIKAQYTLIERSVDAKDIGNWLSFADRVYIDKMAYDETTNRYHIVAYSPNELIHHLLP